MLEWITNTLGDLLHFFGYSEQFKSCEVSESIFEKFNESAAH